MTSDVRRRSAAVVVATVVILVAVAAAVGGRGSPAGAAAPPEPAADPFYRPPDGYQQAAPGTVLRSRPVTVNGVSGVRATQTLFRTTDARDRPAHTSSLVLVPTTAWPGPGPRPLVAYQVPINSLGDQCQPTYKMRAGQEAEVAFVNMLLARGWAVVVTDHEGPRYAYAAGRMAGHAVLDGVRAARSLPGTGLGPDTPVGAWGYSGGAIATGWAAELQPTYAPDVALRGVAAGGTPADLALTARALDGGPFSGIFLLAALGVGREYPETATILNEAGFALNAELADACTDAAARYPFRRFSEFTTVADPLSDPRVTEVMRLNRMGSRAPTAPVYLYHALLDEGIPWAGARQLRDDWCARGGNVRLHTDLLSEHLILAVTGAPAAVSFLGDQFAGRTSRAC